MYAYSVRQNQRRRLRFQNSASFIMGVQWRCKLRVIESEGLSGGEAETENSEGEGPRLVRVHPALLGRLALHGSDDGREAARPSAQCRDRLPLHEKPAAGAGGVPGAPRDAEFGVEAGSGAGSSEYFFAKRPNSSGLAAALA